MSADITVALIGGAVTIVVALITAVEASRRYSATKERNILDKLETLDRELSNKIEPIKVQLGRIALKTDTLWEIYGEEVIRTAKNAGMLASQSRIAPTTEWTSIISLELTTSIERQAIESSRVLNSPYDVFVEVWQIYRNELLQISREQHIPITIITAGVLKICENAIDTHE